MPVQTIDWINRLDAWRRGEAAGPLRVTIFPTNRCNLRCSICWQRWASVDWDELPDERWLRLVDECAAAGVKDWLIIGGGEPMVRANLIMAMVRRIRELDMNGSLHSNGTLFTADHFKLMLDVNWERVTFSLDGPTEEINDAIRSKGSFAKATENIRRLMAMKRERNAAMPGVSLFATITNLTYDKVTDFVELSHSLGCDSEVSISDLIVQGERCEELALSDGQRAEMADHIRRADAKAREYGTITNFNCYLPEVSPEKPGPASRLKLERGDIARCICYEPWLSISILPSGKCGPCCAFYDGDADSLRDKTFQEVWEGGYLREVRRQLQENRPPEFCSRCPSNSIALAQYQHRVYYEHEYWRRLKGGRVGFLARKGFQSIRKYGVLNALKRGSEWMKLHALKAADGENRGRR